MNIGNLCATLVTSYLTTAAPKALINGMVGIHIDRKEGRIKCLFDLQCHQLTKILEPQGTGGAQKRPLTDFFVHILRTQKAAKTRKHNSLSIDQGYTTSQIGRVIYTYVHYIGIKIPLYS